MMSSTLDTLDANSTLLTVNNRLATELRALTVRYDAKRAEIDRDRAIGNEVEP